MGAWVCPRLYPAGCPWPHRNIRRSRARRKTHVFRAARVLALLPAQRNSAVDSCGRMPGLGAIGPDNRDLHIRDITQSEVERPGLSACTAAADRDLLFFGPAGRMNAHTRSDSAGIATGTVQLDAKPIAGVRRDIAIMLGTGPAMVLVEDEPSVAIEVGKRCAPAGF